MNRAGFSLIEIILVIALIALMAGLVIVDTGSLVRTFSAPPIDRQIQQALLEARDIARTNNKAVVLAYAADPARLYIARAEGFSPMEWPLTTSSSHPVRVIWLTPTPAERPQAQVELDIMASRPHLLIDPEGYLPPTIIEWSERSHTGRAPIDPFTLELIQ